MMIMINELTYWLIYLLTTNKLMIGNKESEIKCHIHDQETLRLKHINTSSKNTLFTAKQLTRLRTLSCRKAKIAY